MTAHVITSLSDTVIEKEAMYNTVLLGHMTIENVWELLCDFRVFEPLLTPEIMKNSKWYNVTLTSKALQNNRNTEAIMANSEKVHR